MVGRVALALFGQLCEDPSVSAVLSVCVPVCLPSVWPSTGPSSPPVLLPFPAVSSVCASGRVRGKKKRNTFPAGDSVVGYAGTTWK